MDTLNSGKDTVEISCQEYADILRSVTYPIIAGEVAKKLDSLSPSVLAKYETVNAEWEKLRKMIE